MNAASRGLKSEIINVGVGRYKPAEVESG